jgi:hypothetical protein
VGGRIAVDALMDLLVAQQAGTRVSADHGHTVSRVTLVSEPEKLNADEGVRWELDRNLVRLPLRTHPYWTRPEADYDTQREYLDLVDGYLDRGEVIDDFTTNTDFAGASDRTQEYYWWRRAGVHTHNYSTYIARRIQPVGEKEGVHPDHADAMRVVPLPGDIPPYLGTLPVEFEWLKQPPDVRDAGPGQIEIVTEYWSGMPKWATFYGGTWSPLTGQGV